MITLIAMILIIIKINNGQFLKPKRILKARDIFTRYFFSGKRNSHLKQSSVSPHFILLLAFINNATLKRKAPPSI